MKTFVLLISALCTGHLVLGCNRQSDSRTSGWGVAGTSFGGNTLNVCYENRGFADRELVNVTGALFAHARDEFARTNLSLQGFGPCGPKRYANEIRMTWWDVEDFNPDPNNIRDGLHGMSQIGNGKIYGLQMFGLPQRIPSSVRAEPTLALNSHIFKTTQSKVGISNAISQFQSTFLHEMGHAVGMLHEHAQAKSKCSITPETTKIHMEKWEEIGANANSIRVVGTSYDPSSIMNYCYIFERNSAVAVGFSARDIQTVNALYPKPQERQPQVGQPQVGQPQVGQPQVGQPQVGQPQVGAFKPSDGYGNCNNSQLDNCLKYGGGNACWPKHCECVDLEFCGSPGL